MKGFDWCDIQDVIVQIFCAIALLATTTILVSGAIMFVMALINGF